jgi:hypothetical protein
VRALVEEGMEAGGPAVAVERSWCYIAGDDAWKRLPPALRERLCATASTLFRVELGTYELYLPEEETLAALSAPVRLLVSEGGLPFSAEIAGRLGERSGIDVAIASGTHAAYHDQPYEFAKTVRRLLREVSG